MFFYYALPICFGVEVLVIELQKSVQLLIFLFLKINLHLANVYILYNYLTLEVSCSS